MAPDETAERRDSLVERQAETIERQEELIQALRETVEDQQATIADQEATIDALKEQHAADDGAPAISRRGALKAGGVLAALGLGAGTASADPQGQVGSEDDPLAALHTAALAGPLTGGENVDSLVGNGLMMDNGSLALAIGVPTLTVTPIEILDTDTDDSFTIEVGLEETADLPTDGLSVTLTIVDGSGTIDYEAEIDPGELQNESTTVTFGVDGGTAKLGPFDADNYTATLTVDAVNAVTVTETDSFTVVEPFAGGSGGSNDPYQIENWVQLTNVRDSLDQSFTLVADLDESTVGYEEIASGTANGGSGFDPIGDSSTSFTGTFDGDGYVIEGLTIERGDENYVGLFGATGSGASIENTALGAVDLIGQAYVGGLVGANDGSVTGSYATGIVSGIDIVGGLVGENDSGTVQQSYASTDAIGETDVGGLVGRSFNKVLRSYATGSVSGSVYVGGLLGQNFQTVSESYATGSVSGDAAVGGLTGDSDDTVSDAYWDVPATGQDTSDGGTGLGSLGDSPPAAEMIGNEAESNMSGLDFTDIWATVDAGSDSDVLTDDYPVLQALDRQTQLEVRS